MHISHILIANALLYLAPESDVITLELSQVGLW